jgi:RNA polymerase sigma factor (sigma-70 family)
MHDDTQIGGPDGRFPETRWSLIQRARSEVETESQSAHDRLAEVYWKPVYKYLRLRWKRSNEDAKDLTQEFFARWVERKILEDYDPGKARLRTYVRTCVDHLVQNHDRDGARQKRGGHSPHMSLDFDAAEGELTRTLASEDPPPDALFEHEWIRSVFGLAVDRLERLCEERGHAGRFQLFERYDLADEVEARPTYAQLAEEMEIPVTTVTNHLAAVRREFRRITLEVLREMTGSEEEFRAETRSLLGWQAP